MSAVLLCISQTLHECDLTAGNAPVLVKMRGRLPARLLLLLLSL
jgi:hypothetical protein